MNISYNDSLVRFYFQDQLFNKINNHNVIINVGVEKGHWTKWKLFKAAEIFQTVI